MSRVIKRFSAALLLAASVSSFAQSGAAPAAPTGFQFSGAGTVACKDALPLLNAPNAAIQFEQWFLGFLAAYNAYSNPAQRVSLPQIPALMAYARDVCQANPNVRFIAVAGSALQQLGARVPALQ